jgi:O-antigen/teichoic acid export membrane protein
MPRTMSTIKKLAGQTIIYGASSMIGRFLNFLLTPLYTATLVFSAEQFGIITEMYAYVAFLVVFLTYGMETAFFRYSTLNKNEGEKVYSNALFSLATTTSIFIALAIVFSQDIANWLRYPDHNEYIIWFAIIVGLDALGAVPLAKLRKEGRAKRFALIQFVNVGVNVLLNLFFIACVYSSHYIQTPPIEPSGLEWLVNLIYNTETQELNWFINLVYDPNIGVGYVFIVNLVASIVKFLLLTPFMNFKGEFDWRLLKHMLKYAYPMLFVGLAGIINETLDRTILKRVLTSQYMEAGQSITEATSNALVQLGIYGANYKITMFLAMFIQAFRYAAEPFFFNQEKENNSKTVIAKVMTYFVIVATVIFLGLDLFLPILKYFTPNKVFWIGLKIVPILLLANVFLGLFVNLSIWYKLSSKTNYGAYISIMGATITIVLNFIFIPTFGYVASAWATLACYASMMIASYFLGQKHYPIPYDLKKIGIYLGLGTVLFLIKVPFEPYASYAWYVYLYHFVLIMIFITMAYFLEKPAKKEVLSQP